MHYSSRTDIVNPKVNNGQLGYEDGYKPIAKRDKTTVFCLYGTLVLLLSVQIFICSFIYAKGSLATLVGNVLRERSSTDDSTQNVQWSLWNGNSILPSVTEGKQCRWTPYYLPAETNEENDGAELPICVHPVGDSVSDEIVARGSWSKCASILEVWHDTLNNYPNNERNDGFHTFNKNSNVLFIDIGAGLGACTLQMLLTTNAKVIAFEPNPDNQFCLSNTLLALPPSLRNRVYLYPIALGDVEAEKNIYEERYNSMNSKEAKNRNSPSNNVATVTVERLDQIMNIGTLSRQEKQAPHYIPLVKMNALGHECQILQGMGTILPRVRTLVITFDKQLSLEFGCEEQFMYDFLMHHRYTMFVYEEEMNTERQINSPIARKKYDLIARFIDQ